MRTHHFIHTVRQHGPTLPIAALAITLAATAALYFPGLYGPLIFDDFHNLQVSHVDTLTLGTISEMLRAGGGHAMARPLSYLSLTANLAIVGTDTFYLKLVNLAIHLLIGSLLYLLALRLATLLTPSRPSATHRWIAATTAALWLLQPMHVSTVLYVVQRMAQLSALFVVISLLIYLRLRTVVVHGSRRQIALYVAIFLITALLALGSKQDAVLIPAYILAIEIAAHFGSNAACRSRPTAILVTAAAIVPVSLGVAGAMWLHEFIAATYEMQTFSLTQRLATELSVLWQYVRQLTFPRLAEFGLFHDDTPLRDFADPLTYLALLGWIAMLAAAFALRHRSPITLLGVLFFLAAHALESSVIGLALAFEHRNYLAAFGVVMVLAEWTVGWAGRRAYRYGLASGAAIAVVFVFMTTARVETWSDREDLAHTFIVEHPNSPHSHSTYADYLFRNGEIKRAVVFLLRAAELAPQDAGYPAALLSRSCRHGFYDEALYEPAVEALRTEHISPLAMGALRSLNQMKMNGECEGLSNEQLRRLYNATLTKIDSRAPDRLEGNIHALFGVFVISKFHALETGLSHLEKATDISPRWTLPWTQRIRALIRFGRPERARKVLEEIKRLNDQYIFLEPFTEAELRRLEACIDEARHPSAPPSMRSN